MNDPAALLIDVRKAEEYENNPFKACTVSLPTDDVNEENMLSKIITSLKV